MQKLFGLLIAVLFALNTYSQGIPVADVRVTSATAIFGVNISRGSKVYDAGSNKYYYCVTAATSAETLTTASAKFYEFSTTSHNHALAEQR